jgi:uncharacterized protein YwgA
MGKGELLGLARYLGMAPKKLTAPSSFNERLKVQKAVFLLKHLGVAPFTEYSFGLYLHGPYSTDLAKDYYHLSKARVIPVKLDSNNKKVLNWFTEKDDAWLEVASSILSIKERYKDATTEEIYSILTLSKPWVKEPLCEKIVMELASRGL